MSIRMFALAMLLAAPVAQAQTVIFTDNFNADLRGLNKMTFVGGWTVTNGNVDVIGAGPGNEPGAGPGQPGDATGFNFFPANGNFVDLDGSTDSGLFSKTLTLAGGTSYTATFQLAGSQRNFTESVVVGFGTTTATYSYAPSATFAQSALTFTPSVTGSYTLTFNEPGTGNDQGLLLDNVRVATAVPEPLGCGVSLATIVVLGRRHRLSRRGR